MSHPESIFLQVCDDAMSEWCGEVTWCDFRVHDDDVKYIRADLVEHQLSEVTKQRDELVIALKMIAWGNDSDWQADCAKEVLARVKESK